MNMFKYYQMPWDFDISGNQNDVFGGGYNDFGRQNTSVYQPISQGFGEQFVPNDTNAMQSLIPSWADTNFMGNLNADFGWDAPSQGFGQKPWGQVGEATPWSLAQINGATQWPVENSPSVPNYFANDWSDVDLWKPSGMGNSPEELASALKMYDNWMKIVQSYNDSLQKEKQFVSPLNLREEMFGAPANSYQLAQNNLRNIANDASQQITFEDIYWGDEKRKSTYQIEGGYNKNRVNDMGGETNFAVTQNTLNEYNNWSNPLRTGFNFPKDVKDLVVEQAMQILDERFYQAYKINSIQNLMIARNVFDAEINQGTDAGKLLADTVNEYFQENYPRNMVISSELAEKINNLSEDDAIKINDVYTQKRMKRYFELVDNNHSQINNLKSWYNRARNHYSNQEEFDRIYKSTLDEYLNRKYRDYYTGK